MEALIQKHLIEREQDKTDRRRIHLYLLPAAEPITNRISEIREQFSEEILFGFSEEERKQFEVLNDRLWGKYKKCDEKERNKMSNEKDFLGKEPIGKLLMRLALPTVAAQVINMLYNIVDRIYIGHIPEVGALALTGVGVCMPF